MRTSSLVAIATLISSIVGAPSLAFGQQLRFGMVGGTSLTRGLPTTDDTYPILEPGQPAYQLNVFFRSQSHSLVFGPMVELMLPRSLSLEVNALHRNVESTQVVTSLFPDGSRQGYTDHFVSVKTWEFPVLLKYALPISRARPFVELGPTFRVWQEPQAVEPSNYGVTAGLGTEMNWGRLKIAPVIRYTRWAADGRFPLRSSRPDQVELLASFSYRAEEGSRRLAGRKIWVGLVAGTAVTSGFHLGTFASPQVESLPYAGGLSVEADLKGRLSLEVNGLYRPLHAVTQDQTPYGIFRNPFTILTWQFPVLAKYRLTASKLAPFVEGGPSLRLSGNTNGYSPSRYGGTLGAGVEATVGGVRLAPVVRYTRWATDRYPYPSRGYDLSRTASNQLEVLVGFSF